ncbi:hypothetical protein MP228_000606 [Amoeboaphelidium protococcarum]|nr:hypothetical protein MP228_000606 [Amoeboaphelidium protococcarum]
MEADAVAFSSGGDTATRQRQRYVTPVAEAVNAFIGEVAKVNGDTRLVPPTPLSEVFPVFVRQRRQYSSVAVGREESVTPDRSFEVILYQPTRDSSPPAPLLPSATPPPAPLAPFEDHCTLSAPPILFVP